MKLVVRIFLVALVTFCFSPAASAATFVVNTTADTLDANLGNGACEDAGSNCFLLILSPMRHSAARCLIGDKESEPEAAARGLISE